MYRSKNSHLTKKQKSWIYSQYSVCGKSINQLLQLTGISMSTIRRIIKDFNSNIVRSELYRNIRWREIISKKLKQWISKFVSNQTGWFTAADVQGQIKDRLLVSVSLHQIRKYLKNSEGLSYKKGNPSPLNLDMIRVELLRRLFWVRIAKSISGIEILVNIDESSVTKGTIKNYSWLKTWRSCTITNVKFKSSINMITAITTNGLAINMLQFWSTTAEIFKVFLDYMLSYLIAEGVEPQDIGIILDNCTIHKTRLVREYCKCKGARLFYLP